MIRPRLKEIRKTAGLTMQQLSKLSGVSQSQISRIETGATGWSMDSLVAIAGALQVPVVELLDATGAWAEVQVFGHVGANGHVAPLGNANEGETIKVPAAFGLVLAVRVLGDHLWPRYGDGDLILCTHISRDALSCVGREALVTVDPGVSMLRTVQAGADRKHFVLTSHNGPPIHDAKILSCRPVVNVQRAD